MVSKRIKMVDPRTLKPHPDAPEHWSGMIHFKDEGQDFLTWKVVNGVVVECQPFQDWVWKGAIVHNTTIVPGVRLDITPHQGKRMILKELVEKIE